MAEAQLIFQRSGSMLVTPGNGLDRILRSVRCCAQLRSIVAGNYLYDLSLIALWGAAARGVTAIGLLSDLAKLSSTPVPVSIAARIADAFGRYGAIAIEDRDSGPSIVARSQDVLAAIGVDPPADGSTVVALPSRDIARVKLAAVQAGWPVVDRRQRSSSSTAITLRGEVTLRSYQSDALTAIAGGRDGVVLLPCGAGKTMVGVAAASQTGGPVLVLVPSRTVGEQWRAAFAVTTDCQPDDVRWMSDTPSDSPIALSTYHAATTGNVAGELVGRRWRLVIYDEVQSLPADMFRLAAAIEADRRLGLSATLVREDGREDEVYALVGPPLYEASWLELERDGWIAPARCVEVRVPAGSTRADSLRYRMAVVQRLLAQHDHAATIVVGTDVASLRAIGQRLDFPVLTGASSAERRAGHLGAFRAGDLKTLGLSRIGSVGIDLPDASVLIQVSGTFGSRQEEAQRLGRVLRPATGKTAHFYTIVAERTREQHFAARRQRFLVNQGYTYEILDAALLPRSPASR